MKHVFTTHFDVPVSRLPRLPGPIGTGMDPSVGGDASHGDNQALFVQSIVVALAKASSAVCGGFG